MGSLAKLNHPDSRNLLRRVTVCPEPIDASSNASYVITWTGTNVTKITKTIDGVSYERTLSYDGSDNLTGITVWTEV